MRYHIIQTLLLLVTFHRQKLFRFRFIKWQNVRLCECSRRYHGAPGTLIFFSPHSQSSSINCSWNGARVETGQASRSGAAVSGSVARVEILCVDLGLGHLGKCQNNKPQPSYPITLRQRESGCSSWRTRSWGGGRSSQALGEPAVGSMLLVGGSA